MQKVISLTGNVFTGGIKQAVFDLKLNKPLDPKALCPLLGWTTRNVFTPNKGKVGKCAPIKCTDPLHAREWE
jgi:hypothetical protein